MEGLRGVKIRLLQVAALFLPGGSNLRLRLHRWRGVDIGRGVFISTDVIIETMHPELVSIGNDVFLGARSMIIAHFNDVTPTLLARGTVSVRLEDQAWVGPGGGTLWSTPRSERVGGRVLPQPEADPGVKLLVLAAPDERSKRIEGFAPLEPGEVHVWLGSLKRQAGHSHLRVLLARYMGVPPRSISRR